MTPGEAHAALLDTSTSYVASCRPPRTHGTRTRWCAWPSSGYGSQPATRPRASTCRWDRRGRRSLVGAGGAPQPARPRAARRSLPRPDLVRHDHRPRAASRGPPQGSRLTPADPSLAVVVALVCRPMAPPTPTIAVIISGYSLAVVALKRAMWVLLGGLHPFLHPLGLRVSLCLCGSMQSGEGRPGPPTCLAAESGC